MSKRGAVSGDELRGILRTTDAIEKAREAERRKRELVKKQVQKGVHDFVVGTDGVYYAGSLIKLTPSDFRLVTRKQRRIEEMEAKQLEYKDKDGNPTLFKKNLIDHAKRELQQFLTDLLFASYRAPQRIELTDELGEDKPKETVWTRVRRGFGRKPKDEKVIERIEDE
jgi:hypothetical protein